MASRRSRTEGSIESLRPPLELGSTGYGTGFNAVPLKERPVPAVAATAPDGIDPRVQPNQPGTVAARTDPDSPATASGIATVFEEIGSAEDATRHAPLLEMLAIPSRDEYEHDESFTISSNINTNDFDRSELNKSENISRIGVTDELRSRAKRTEAREEKLAGPGLNPVAGFQSPSGRRRRDTQAKRTVPPRPTVSTDAVSPRCGSSDSARSGDSVEWPSAQEILATYRARPIPSTPKRETIKSGKRTVTHALPTSACEPGQWAIPLWIAWPPLAVLVVVVGVMGCFLSWSWASDSYSAALMTDRLMVTDVSTRRTPLPDSVGPPTGSWTRTTAQHLAHWAIYLQRSDASEETSPPDIHALLTAALQVSPINATARLVQAQLERATAKGKTSIRELGLSRDPLSLAWTARQLLADGKKEAALNVYRQALDLASRTEFRQIAPPRFSNDPDVPRFLLPGEERIRDIIGEQITNYDWTVGDWQKVVPKRTFVPLAMARSLREQGRKEVADALLDLILNESRSASADRSIESLRLASRAEALALRSRWQEADQIYREAIELLDDATVRRSWWFNLADIAFRLADDTKRQSALQATLTAANSDEISRRTGEILRTVRARPGLRSNGTKAN